MTEKKAFTCREVCRLTSIGRTKLNDEIREGKLRALKLGSRTVILAEDLAAWLQDLPVRATRPFKQGGGNGTVH